jgi:hypothetical protein
VKANVDAIAEDLLKQPDEEEQDLGSADRSDDKQGQDD